MNAICAHYYRIGDGGWLRCDQPAVRKSWRHRHVPDIRATWLCWRHWYREYLQSGHWAFLRKRKLSVNGIQCERCGRFDQPQIHHRTYERVGAELLEDLEVLCSDCHQRHHRIAVG